MASKERFTPQLHKVFQVARTEMKRYQLHINSKMLLLAMTRVRGAVAYQVLDYLCLRVHLNLDGIQDGFFERR